MSADILEACAQGRLPPHVALMHLAASSDSEDAFRSSIDEARRSEAAPLSALCALADRHTDCWRLTRELLAIVDHGSAPSIEGLAAMFDAAVDLSPAASVALYSLGDESELADAAADIVAMMDEAGLLGPDKDALDLGCGIGRVTIALAPRVRSVTGLDISSRMIAEARRRCAALPNVSLAVGSGRGLDGVADASLDLILAADVFPYFVQLDPTLAQTHLADSARVLREDGALLILNFSYRGDPDLDRSDIARMSPPTLVAAPAPSRALRSWDAARFLLRKRA